MASPRINHSELTNERFTRLISESYAWLAIALSGDAEKAFSFLVLRIFAIHAQERLLIGGGRAQRHAGRSRSSFFIGSPQHGHKTT